MEEEVFMGYLRLVNEMYRGKKDLIILGLTGRTGSGCSTIAKILESKEFKDLDLKKPKDYDFENVEDRKYKILYEFMQEDCNWQSFQTIELSSVILYFALNGGADNIIKWIEDLCEEKKIQIPEKNSVIKELNNNLNDVFDAAKNIDFDAMERLSKLYTVYDEPEKFQKELGVYYNYFLHDIKKAKETFRNIFDNYICYQIIDSKECGKERIKHKFYTYIMQMLGNNLRQTGSPFGVDLSDEKYNCFIKKIEVIIEMIRRYDEEVLNRPTRICIDAIRNPYEAHYLHDYYRSFILLAISTEDEDRKGRLGHLNQEEMKNLDAVEYPLKFDSPSERFYHQNIQECLEIADIHIYNPNKENNKYYYLSQQLLKYVALMIHPGLVTPTHIERCMQLAFNAKYNSGCLSRQVGAVITRGDFSVQSVGWNDVPKGQISCGLRDIFNYDKNNDDSTYSQYELESKEFGCAMKKLCERIVEKRGEKIYPYCFKDIYNGLKNDKNQVYTRALHAEENAFLQISKYGGTQIQGGYLFVTASPCELCPKKSFQLGIKRIYYIDPYPGISQKHIISYNNGEKPEMHLFYGAIGNAYMELYSQRIPYKDELELLTGVKPKEVIKDLEEQMIPSFDNMSYTSVVLTLEFDKDLSKVSYKKQVKGKVLCQNLEKIEEKIRWTGDKVISIKGDKIERKKSIGEYHYYCVHFNPPIEKEKTFEYNIIASLSNEGQIMRNYFSTVIKYLTCELIMTLSFPKEIAIDLTFREYADKEMTIQIKSIKLQDEIEGFERQDEENTIIYKFTKKNPNVNYNYVLEWEYINTKKSEKP